VSGTSDLVEGAAGRRRPRGSAPPGAGRGCRPYPNPEPTSRRYVFVYAVHYFFMKTKMTGFFQTCFYFGYTAMLCLGLAVLCGALGYLASAAFVRRIYRSIKCD